MTANLVFAGRLYAYHLVVNHTNTGAFKFKLPRGAQSGALVENLSIKYHEQKFCIKFACSGQYWTGKSIEKCKNPVFGVLIKITIWVLNFITESAKKPKVYHLLFFTAIYSPKNDNKHPSKKRN